MNMVSEIVLLYEILKKKRGRGILQISILFLKPALV